MNTLVLYATTVLIWGSTWLAITYQAGDVTVMASVAYRFLLASALLLAYCILIGKRLRFSWTMHGLMLLQGACLFGLNYWLIYHAALQLTSGLVAVIFSTIVIMNMLNGRIFLKRKIESSVVFASLIGLMGIVLVFLPEFENYRLQSEMGLAFGLAVVGTYLASLGNIVSFHTQKKGLPILQSNAIGMGYGGLFMLLLTLINDPVLIFDWGLEYIASMLYLTIFGSIIAFGCYLTLVGRLGADKAAYATLLFPLVALQLSSWFEGYQWTAMSLFGLGLVLFGNVIALMPKERRQRLIQYMSGRLVMS